MKFKQMIRSKIICLTTIGAKGLVPGMSYKPPIPDQSDLPNHVMVNEVSPEIGDNLHRALIPPVQFFDATGTITSSSFIT